MCLKKCSCLFKTIRDDHLRNRERERDSINVKKASVEVYVITNKATK